MIEGIPRLEGVRKVLSAVAGGGGAEWGGLALRAVLDLDVLETQGRTRGEALAKLRAGGLHEATILDGLAQLPVAAGGAREIDLAELRPGMVLLDDVRTKGGTLLVARGHQVTSSLLERIRNLSGSMLVTGMLRISDREATR